VKRLALLLALVLWGCGGPARRFTKSMTLGGKTVSAHRLNRGAEAYVVYCSACHGLNGDGKGPAAAGLRPPPRDFTQAKFKFAAVSSGELPNDEDIVRSVKLGLHGTAMLAWNDVPPADVDAIVDFLKTLSTKWADGTPGAPIVASPDPWGVAKKNEAIARGKLVYHGFAQCLLCHPAYASQDEVNEASLATTKRPATLRDDPFHAQMTPSEFGPDLMPPDFTRDPIRAGETLPDLYRTIASGVGGTAMPSWKGAMPEGDIWALAYYVRSLAGMRGTVEAEHLKGALTVPAHAPGPS
jgi:mono/diheme cytochrome c family protein